MSMLSLLESMQGCMRTADTSPVKGVTKPRKQHNYQRPSKLFEKVFPKLPQDEPFNIRAVHMLNIGESTAYALVQRAIKLGYLKKTGTMEILCGQDNRKQKAFQYAVTPEGKEYVNSITTK